MITALGILCTCLGVLLFFTIAGQLEQSREIKKLKREHISLDYDLQTATRVAKNYREEYEMLRVTSAQCEMREAQLKAGLQEVGDEGDAQLILLTVYGRSDA